MHCVTPFVARPVPTVTEEMPAVLAAITPAPTAVALAAPAATATVPAAAAQYAAPTTATGARAIHPIPSNMFLPPVDSIALPPVHLLIPVYTRFSFEEIKNHVKMIVRGDPMRGNTSF